MPEHPDLEDEQEFLNRAYDGLEFMRGEARQMLQGVLDLGRGGTFQSRTERDIVVRTSLARLEQLDIGDQALYFGRIDRLPEPGVESTRRTRCWASPSTSAGSPSRARTTSRWSSTGAPPWPSPSIGPRASTRRAWPAAATSLSGAGRCSGSRTSTSSTRKAAPGAFRPGGSRWGSVPRRRGAPLSDGLVLGGPGALLSALGQARTGQMGDIIGTIQREQDEIIRSPLPGVLVVQGGPGTGKTAVALHRAAYLLYTHRFPLERQGVLVVGPNPLFLRYIEQVLPSLGETGVSLSTVSGLVPEVRVRGVDDPAVAKLKGDVRMVNVLRRAVRTRQRPLRRDVEIPFGAGVLRLRARLTEDIVGTARRRPGTHNARRRFVEAQVLRALSDEYRARLGRSGVDGADEPPTAEEQKDLAQRLRRVPEVADALDRMWPRLSAHEFLHDLLGARALLTAAGKGIFSGGHAAAVPAAQHLARHGAVDGRRRRPDRRGAHAARPPAGSARPVARQAGRGGDGLGNGVLAAGTGGIARAGAQRSDRIRGRDPGLRPHCGRRGAGPLAHAVAHAGPPVALGLHDRRGRHRTGHRALGPGRVGRHHAPPEPAAADPAGGADRELPHPGRGRGAGRPGPGRRRAGIPPPRPVRQSGFPPRIVATSRFGLGATLAELAREEVAAVAPGRVAVLGPTVMLPELTRALDEAGLDPIDPATLGDGLAAGLVVLPADETNGLEFDSVIVVEPSLIAAVGDDLAGEGPPVPTTRGLRTLYVAFTRPTRRLTVLHAEPLPVELR